MISKLIYVKEIVEQPSTKEYFLTLIGAIL